MKKNLDQTICPSLTGSQKKDWQGKLNEVNNLGLTTIALMIQYFPQAERALIYRALEESSVKHIPLVHLNNNMGPEELKYLCDKFGSRYLTIHEDSFKGIKKWQGYYRHLFLELNFDDVIAQDVKVKKIGGFCVDLAHFKAAEENWTKEFEYIIKKRGNKKLFACNHLSGYSPAENIDLHHPKKLEDFAYLKTLPDFIFGRVIALEIDNPISEQLEFKKGISKLLGQA